MNDLPTISRPGVEILDHVNLPVWMFSRETLQICVANQVAQDLLGYDLAALQSMTIADLRPQSERDAIVEEVRRFVGATADVGTWTIVSRSGEHFVGHFTWSKVCFEGSVVIVASIRDMTPISRTEALISTPRAQNKWLRGKANLPAEHLAHLVDGLPGKMVALTPGDYTVVAVTDEYAQALKLERGAMIGKHLFDLFSDDLRELGADGVADLRDSLQRVEALRATDVMKLQSYPVRRPAGSFEKHFWLSTNKPVLDAEGTLAHIVHQVEDINTALNTVTTNSGDQGEGHGVSTQELLEARSILIALRERDTRLNAAERLLGLGEWELDIDSGRIAWSDRAFDIHGVPRNCPIRSIDDYMSLLPPDDRDAALMRYRTFVESGASELEYEHRIIRSDGYVTYVRGIGSRHHLYGKETVIGFVQDVTSMRHAEKKLQNEAQRRRFSSRLVSLGSWRYELGQPHITWDDEVAAIHDEPPGTSPSVAKGISYYIPEHRNRIHDRFENCIQAGLPFDEICQIVSAKSRRVWVRAIGEPVRDALGAIIAVEGAFQDISDLIGAWDTATELSARLRATLEGMSDAFFLLDEDWNFSFINSRAESLLQRPNGSLVGTNIWVEFPEAAGSKFEEQYRRAVAERCSVRFEAYFVPLEAWFEVSADPMPQGLAIYFRDITEMRGRNQQLRLLETAAARLNDILLITEAEPIDAPGGPKIVYVNDGFVRRTGFSREEAIGSTPRILQGPKTQRSELDRIRQAMKKWKPVRAELINYTKSGEEFWLELDIVPVADDTGWYTHWVAIERDVTDRKRAEEALKANEERFRLVTRAAGSAIWEWEAQTDHQWWSEGLREIFRHPLVHISGNATVWRQNVHPDDIGRIDAAFHRFLAGEDSFWRETYRFRRGDGSWATVEDSAFIQRDDVGSIVRILGIMTDVTEKSQLEERLRQAQKMEGLGQLTGGIAHDFNNLLMIILGSAEVLVESLGTQPALRKLAKMALDAADRGATLTSQLLSFSRKQPLLPEIVNAAKLIHRMEHLLRRTLPASIEIGIECSDHLWRIEVDAAQLESAILNLALNARDAMPDGGQLIIRAENATLDENYQESDAEIKPGQYVVLTVTDTGHGIHHDNLSRLFDPFFTTKDVGKGSGLGLSMIFGFAKQSGGHICVSSKLDEGTSFKLFFPRTKKREQTVIAAPGSMVAGGTEAILVVEDDPGVREHVSEQLRGLGYDVYEASSGKAALELLRRTPAIDLLFTDVVMPGGMGGRGLAEAACEIRPDIAVLFTSGYIDNSFDHHRKFDQGIKLLSKPYRREQLAAKVRELLNEKTKRDGLL